ncbi:CDP-glucose 4,6-dehydratase [Lysobacter sp. Root494]|uniref:CDP-glucose 4,6-dehydratase n=1 Tax=Lysobacter sp. Root494 TaxID=1736549 RepID=UPI0006FEFFBB|nr:CDP-glucose 4,6-dehydratase [Lysobacter sp. Root494]KQY49722.1 CDP-glucose 4,6-dehydratase [Lysobacter sp. Root494]
MEGLGLSTLFGGAYSGRRVLVTGHTGFKGSWLAMWLQALGAELAGLALPPDTEPSHWRLLDMKLKREYLVDVRDRGGVLDALHDFQPEFVFHLAAQPLVRRSYREPVETFATNVLGLVHLLEAARHCDSVRVLVNATTDKVYEPFDVPGGYCEDDILGGHDPYSTSKACAELVSACYRRSYFDGADSHAVRLATARAGNVIGGGDWAEDRLVPDVVRAMAGAGTVRLRNPMSTRPWQHVLEPLSGYLCLAQAMIEGREAGGAWNFGPSRGSTMAVGDVVRHFQHEWPGLQVEHDAGPHPHEAEKLTLDCGKAARELGWHSVWDAEPTVAHTARWYRDFLDAGHIHSRQDLDAYVASARRQRQAWAS